MASRTTATYAVGIVNHRTYDDLEGCLESVLTQSRQASRLHVIDCDAEAGRFEGLRRDYPGVDVQALRNRGFAAAANRVITAAHAAHVDYVLILNPDVVLEPGFAEALLREVEGRPQVAIASGKLLRPDGHTLDSAGIVLPRHRRPRDRGSETPDRGQYDRTEPVFGVSGAAMLLACEALPALAVNGEVFDEDFFAYYEDTDLCWRAARLGWTVLYVPAARATHVRRWRPRGRAGIEREVRRHSFKNHYLQILKNERVGDLLRNLPALAAWEVVRLGFALAFDRALLGAYVRALRLAPRAWSKRRQLERALDARVQPIPTERWADTSP